MFDPLEDTAASFTSVLAQKLPPALKSLAFASPVSARSPDIFLCWHPGYKQSHRLDLLIAHTVLFLVKKCKGLLALFQLRKNFYYKVYGVVQGSILVHPALCGQEKQGQWQTRYVKTNPSDAVFVFGFGSRWSTDAVKVPPISIAHALGLAWCMFWEGIKAFARMKGTWLDRTLILLLWGSWVVSFEWLEPYYLTEQLEKLIPQNKISKVGCIHEMHGYTRPLWILAHRLGCRTFSMQHASITDGKRWYFPHPQEVAAGLQQPQKIIVYEQAMTQLLRPYFPKSHFSLGCSWRYAQWKDVRPLPPQGQNILFVSALAGFDNSTLINVLQGIRKEHKIPAVHVRFHPLARLTSRQRQWIRKEVQQGYIVLTGSDPLMDDLAKAKVVIGMGTTVLEEALLLGKPVVHIQDRNYLSYIHLKGIDGAVMMDWDKITSDMLLNINPGGLVTDIRHRFGLDLSIVDYSRFFAQESQS